MDMVRIVFINFVAETQYQILQTLLTSGNRRGNIQTGNIVEQKASIMVLVSIYLLQKMNRK